MGHCVAKTLVPERTLCLNAATPPHMTLELRRNRCETFVRRLAMGRSSAGIILSTLWVFGSGSPMLSAPPTGQDSKPSYEADARDLTLEQRAGRNTWYFWTGGGEKVWRELGVTTRGNVDLLLYV